MYSILFLVEVDVEVNIAMRRSRGIVTMRLTDEDRRRRTGHPRPCAVVSGQHVWMSVHAADVSSAAGRVQQRS